MLSLLPAAPLRCHQLKEDTQFREFLSVHQKRTQTATWANDALDAEPRKGKGKLASDYLNFDSDSGQESEEEGAGGDLAEEDGLEPKAAVQKELSDMDYLKSKVVRAESPSSLEEEEEESEDEAVNCDEGSEAEDGDACAAPNRQDRDRMEPRPEAGTPSGDRKPQEARAEVCGYWGVLGRPGR